MEKSAGKRGFLSVLRDRSYRLIFTTGMRQFIRVFFRPDTLLAIFTIVLAISTVGLWLATRDLVKDSRDAAEQQLRAYVYVGPGDSDLEKTSDGSFTFTVNPSEKVFGITPAAMVHPSWNLIIMPASPSGQLPPFASIPGRPDASSVVEIPAQEYKLGSKSVVISHTDADALKDKRKLLVAFGTIMYNDVFRKQRWTEFCWVFDWNNTTIKNATLCQGHNDADWSGNPYAGNTLPLSIIFLAPSHNRPEQKH